MCGGGGSSGSNAGTQTIINQQQLPAYEQQFAQNTQDLSRQLTSGTLPPGTIAPYPQYDGRMVQPFNYQQKAAFQGADQNAYAYQPGMDAAYYQSGLAANPWIGDPNAVHASGANNIFGNVYGTQTAPGGQLAPGSAFNALSNQPQQFNTPGAAQGYMNPYVRSALNPQLQVMNQQLAMQQQGINSQAAGANAYGDGRMALSNALANQNADLQIGNVTAQGYNTAFGQAQQAFAQDQQNKLAQEQANLGAFNSAQGAANQQFGNQMQGFQTALQGQQANQQLQMQNAQLLGQLGGQSQQYGLNAANELFNSGTQQQQQKQQELNIAYQNFLNQTNWPFQMLNVNESTLQHTPYAIGNAVTIPAANQVATGIGAFSSLAGGIGSLFNNTGGNTTNSSVNRLG